MIHREGDGLISEERWYKGNIHTHTLKSDGDISPEEVVRWYGRHGYDFLTLTDHDILTLVGHLHGTGGSAITLLIPGEEIVIRPSDDDTEVHVNAIGISRQIEPIAAQGLLPSIQANVDSVLKSGGIASINHPNYGWALGHEIIICITGASLLEVFNGEPSANMYGAPGRPSNEQIWDNVLSAGTLMFGVATDDAHNYLDFSPGLSNPGRGWVMVRATQLTEEAMVEALSSGNFYASTGVALPQMEISQENVQLTIEQDWDYIYTTTFTGQGGATLAEDVGLVASYRVRGDEGYVRATVTCSNGTKAWTQPIWLQ